MEKIRKTPVSVERTGSIAIIRFIRPEIRNPLSVETLLVLKRHFETSDRDHGIKAVIFTGSGNTFAAGANIREVANLDKKSAREFGLRGQELMRAIYGSKKETIAAINGFCMGGALDLALACNSRIATPQASFAHPGVKLGIITGWGGTQFLPRLIGRKRALDMLLTGRAVGAEEALKFGLIDAIEENPLAKSVERLRE